MPPFVQSASWQGLIRQAGRLLIRAGSKPPKATKVKSPILRQIKHIVQTTFPSASTPAHLLELSPARLPRSETFTRAQQLHRARHALTQASRGFRTSVRRPAVPAPVDVGLGTARNFSSGAGAGTQVMNAKVPMALRALSSLVDSDIDGEAGWPRLPVYRPYDAKRLAKVATKVAASKSGSTPVTIESTRRAFERYFTPAAQADQLRTDTVGSSSNLLRPEQLVTPGVNTTLTIPLAPSYHSIFELPPAEPFRADQLGIDRFANLLRGVMTLHEIIDNRASHFVIPLINKLDSLGLTDPVNGGCEMHVSHADVDGYAIPESISIKLYDRSAEDIRRLLGESLRQAHEGDWWILTEHRLDHELTPAEGRAMLEQWDGQTARQPMGVDTSRLVMPLVDIDEPAAPPSRWGGNSFTRHETDQWSDASTPSTLLDDSPDLDPSIYSTDSDSLFADMLSSQLETLDQDHLPASPRSEFGSVLTLSSGDSLFDAAQQEWQEL